VLESLVGSSARCVVTTHYSQIKALPLTNPKFVGGAMQFSARNEPTFKLKIGVAGESFALAVAERMRLPSDVLERAKSLLSEETVKVASLAVELEELKEEWGEKVEEAERREREARTKQRDMERKQEELEKLRMAVRREEARRMVKVVEEKERVMGELLEKLQADSEGGRSTVKILGSTWDGCVPPYLEARTAR
jgi:DNA mismatch repair protein MutS2